MRLSSLRLDMCDLAQLGVTVQVNALSNMRKAKLGRLEPTSQLTGSLKVKHTAARTLSALPADLVAKHEALVRVNTAKRFAKQGAAQCFVLSQPDVQVCQAACILMWSQRFI